MEQIKYNFNCLKSKSKLSPIVFMFVKTFQMHLKQLEQVFKNDWPVEKTFEIQSWI